MVKKIPHFVIFRLSINTGILSSVNVIMWFILNGLNRDEILDTEISGPRITHLYILQSTKLRIQAKRTTDNYTVLLLPPDGVNMPMKPIKLDYVAQAYGTTRAPTT